MPRVGPIKRKDLIRYLRQLSFDGPYSGGKHQFMLKGTLSLRVPNPHQSDIEFYCRPGLSEATGRSCSPLNLIIRRVKNE